MIQGSAEWLAKREKCAVTCSEYADAIGVGYKSRAKLLREKLGLDERQEANWRMEEGTRREPWIAEVYLQLMDLSGEQVTLAIDAFRVLAEDKRFGGSVDRLVRWGDRTLVLECKTCPEAEDFRPYIPHGHLVQMCGLCKLYDLRSAHYICSTYERGIYLAEITFDPRLWEETIYPALCEFADHLAQKKDFGRMPGGVKASIMADIAKWSFIAPIDTRVQLPELQ